MPSLAGFGGYGDTQEEDVGAESEDNDQVSLMEIQTWQK